MAKKKVAIIANPFSGTNRKEKLKGKIFALNNGFFDLSFSFSEYAGHIAILVREAIDSGAEIIVAVGGDGTVNEVATEIYKSKKDIVLGILPAGSGNGFAMHMGLGRDPVKAFQFILNQKYKWVDTCQVNDKFFLNVSGLGFDARIAYLTKKSKSRGFKRYFLTTMKEIPNFSAMQLKIKADDKVYEGRYAAVVVANATMYGYNFTIAPTAALDDGLFDLVLFKEAPVYHYLLHSYRFLTKTLHKAPMTEVIKAKNIFIECDRQDYFHVDGEGFTLDKNLHYQIIPKGMRVIAADGIRL